MKKFLLLLSLALPVCLSARPKPIIFDTDWWTDVDDACAIRLLLDAERNNEVELLGICLSALNSTSVASISSFIDYEGRHGLPLAADKAAVDYNGKPSYHKVIMDAHPSREYADVGDCEDCVEFYRRLLSKSRRKVDIVAVGYPNALSRLLESGPDKYSRLDGRRLVKKKVGHLWMMAGQYPSGRENNFHRTARSRKAGHVVCTQWPTEITFLGFEVGIKVVTGAPLPENDLLKKVLVAHGSAAGRYSWDPMTARIACIGDAVKAGYDVVRGTISLDPETGANTFEPSPEGRHEYVVLKHDPSWYVDDINGILLKNAKE